MKYYFKTKHPVAKVIGASREDIYEYLESNFNPPTRNRKR